MKKVIKNIIDGIVSAGVIYSIVWFLCSLVEWVCGDEKRLIIIGTIGFIGVVKVLMDME